MASKSASSTSTAKTRKPRAKKVRTFVAHLGSEANPTIVIAHTQKDAIASLLRLREASSQDLFNAGAKGYDILDLTTQQNTAETAAAAGEDGPYPRAA